MSEQFIVVWTIRGETMTAQYSTQNAALQQRIITRGNGLHGQAANPRPRENRFRYDGAGEQRAKLQSQNGDDRNQRVAQTMPK